jgi:hypothetical protein
VGRGAYLDHVDGLDDAGGEHAGGAAVDEGFHGLPPATRRDHLLLLRLRHLRRSGLRSWSRCERREELVVAAVAASSVTRHTAAAASVKARGRWLFMVRGQTMDVGPKWISVGVPTHARKAK